MKTDIAGLRKMILKEQGLSGVTIVSVLVPKLRDLCLGCCGSFGLGSTPVDADDFDRCYRYLKMIHNGPSRINIVAKKYPQWSKMAKHWDELSALYEKEITNTSRRAPKLYKRMQEIRGTNA